MKYTDKFPFKFKLSTTGIYITIDIKELASFYKDAKNNINYKLSDSVFDTLKNALEKDIFWQEISREFEIIESVNPLNLENNTKLFCISLMFLNNLFELKKNHLIIQTYFEIEYKFPPMHDIMVNNNNTYMQRKPVNNEIKTTIMLLKKKVFFYFLKQGIKPIFFQDLMQQQISTEFLRRKKRYILEYTSYYFVYFVAKDSRITKIQDIACLPKFCYYKKYNSYFNINDLSGRINATKKYFNL